MSSLATNRLANPGSPPAYNSNALSVPSALRGLSPPDLSVEPCPSLVVGQQTTYWGG